MPTNSNKFSRERMAVQWATSWTSTENGLKHSIQSCDIVFTFYVIMKQKGVAQVLLFGALGIWVGSNLDISFWGLQGVGSDATK